MMTEQFSVTLNHMTTVALRLRNRTQFDQIVSWCKESLDDWSHQERIPYNNYYWDWEMRIAKVNDALPIMFTFANDTNAILFKLTWSQYL
jgi:hypothetical protein